MIATPRLCIRLAAALAAGAALLLAQPPSPGPQPELVRQGQQLLREGKLEDALALYRKELAANPDSLPAHNAIGIALDLQGRYPEARQHFAVTIDKATSPASKAQAQRAMAMSFAFAGDCRKTGEWEQKVFDFYLSTGDAYQQGEIADEAGRVCIEAGDLEAAAKWYKTGHDAGLKQPDIPRDRKDLWEFRYEHALARIAARRGNKAEAEKHVAEARALLDQDAQMAQQQAPFLPYLMGYVAFYTGDYKKALDDLGKANQNDPFIQCLMGEAHEKLGEKDRAMEYYRKAAAATAHNPPAAYARPFARKKLG